VVVGAGAARAAPPARAAEDGGWAGPGRGQRRQEVAAGGGGGRDLRGGGRGLRGGRCGRARVVPRAGAGRRVAWKGKKLEVEDEGEPLYFNLVVQKIE